jgi:hypothetical protein
VSSFETAVRAPDVSSYLASKGWQRDGERRGASIWHLGNQARLLVPDLQQYDDADLLIQEAVAKIAKFEARPERDVWRDIAEPMIDAQFFRLHPEAPSGSIPLPAGVRAVQGIFDVMKAAASVTEQGTPLLVEGNRTPLVKSFLRRVLLGSAVPGSYVLTARVPTALVGTQELEILDDNREFSGRAVVARLHTAVMAARTAAEQVVHEGHELDVFYSAAESGVSANLCKALSDLGGERRDRPFEIGFSWARGLPGQEPVPEITFTSEMPAILAKAGEELTTLARKGTARISGTITDLHAESYEPPRIKVWGDLQAPRQAKLLRHRSIWIVLSEAAYNEAIEAHRDRLDVAAAGELTTTGRRLELRASSFEVLR